MDELLNLAKIDARKLQNYLIHLVSRELTNLNDACYYPKLKSNYYDLLNLTGLTDSDVKKHGRKFIKQSKAGKAGLQVVLDPFTILNIFISYYFISNNNIVGFSTSVNLQAIRQYSNLFHRSFKFCNPEVFKYSIEKLSPNHLVKKQKGFSGFIYYLSKSMISKYLTAYKNGNPEKISVMIIELRTRISQSLKSFATIYYKASEEKTSFKEPKEIETEQGTKVDISKQEKYSKISSEIAKRLTVYKYTDFDSISKISKILTISKKNINDTVKKIMAPKYTDSLTLIVKTFLSSLQNVSQLCGKDFAKIIKKLQYQKKSLQIESYKTKVISLGNELNLNNKEKLTLVLYLAFVTRKILC